MDAASAAAAPPLSNSPRWSLLRYGPEGESWEAKRFGLVSG
jgi:hypothetical protein